MRQPADEDGVRAYGNGAGGEAAGFRFAFEQELLRGFGSAAASGPDLGGKFRRGCISSFGFPRNCRACAT